MNSKLKALVSKRVAWQVRQSYRQELILTICQLFPAYAGHNYIGTEHVLLGLLREGEGVAARVLETLGADAQKIRSSVSIATLVCQSSSGCVQNKTLSTMRVRSLMECYGSQHPCDCHDSPLSLQASLTTSPSPGL